MSNEINLNHNGCKVKIAGNVIYCEHPSRASTTKWQITLLPNQLIYTAPKERKVLQVANIKELVYEMGQMSRSGMAITASVYVIYDTDDDPKPLFILGTHEAFTYNNQTQAYAICTEILQYIGQRYQVPYTYKLGVDTKEKDSRIWKVILAMIITWLIIFLRLKFGKA